MKSIERILINRKEIKNRVLEIAAEINRDYRSKSLVCVCILRGAALFFADLFREITADVEVDFIALSSYEKDTSSGEVKLVKDLSEPIENKHVLIVEDIIDTGLTLSYLKRMLEARNPASVKVCSLLDKPSRRRVEMRGDYIGFKIADEFVVGCGMDYQGKFRNLKDICVLKKSVYGGE